MIVRRCRYPEHHSMVAECLGVLRYLHLVPRSERYGYLYSVCLAAIRRANPGSASQRKVKAGYDGDYKVAFNG